MSRLARSLVGTSPQTVVGQQRTALPGEDNYGFVDRYTAGTRRSA